ncbi:MAG: hypothetical protein WKF68_09635 [Daejeonella sp.]
MRIFVFILIVFVSKAQAQDYPYAFEADAGLLIGNNIFPSFTARIFNGVRIDKWKIEAGIISGVDTYKQITVLPLSAGLKWMPIRSGSLTPFFGLSAGYGFSWLQRRVENHRYEGGAMFNPSIGLKIKTKWKAGMNLSIGFKQQSASVYQIYYDMAGKPFSTIEEEYKFSRLSINYGLNF